MCANGSGFVQSICFLIKLNFAKERKHNAENEAALAK
jgi:hypothetical protein